MRKGLPIALACLFACLPSLLHGERAVVGKAPDQWTNEERLAARFAPGSAERRLDAISKRSRSTLAAEISGYRYVDVVDGASDPALLFPVEVFRNFANRVLPPIQRERSEQESASIERMMGRAEAEGLPANLRALVVEKGAEYQELRRRHATEITSMVEKRPRRADASTDTPIRDAQEVHGKDQCRAIHSLMKALARELGEAGNAKLFAFLYREVAPTMLIVHGRDDAPLETPLRQYVGGCQ